jgi:hypothetical protein
VDAATLEYRRHGPSKLTADRRRYRQAFRALQQKHERLYGAREKFAQESDLTPAGRLFYRFFWGPRPLPARVESFAQRLVWGRPGAQ